MHLTGDVFFNATDEDVFKNNATLAACRKKCFPARFKGGHFSEYSDRVCNPGNLRCKAEFEEHFSACGIPPPHFADLEHHVGFGQTPGNILPSLDTHAKIFSWVHDRLATPRELYTAMGVDMELGIMTGSRPLSPFAELIPRCSHREQLLFVGNGMHVPTMAAWFLYVLARCKMVDDLLVASLGQSRRMGCHKRD